MIYSLCPLFDPNHTKKTWTIDTEGESASAIQPLEPLLLVPNEKVLLHNPVLTGTPKVPTPQDINDKSNKIANIEFVESVLEIKPAMQSFTTRKKLLQDHSSTDADEWTN
jgi:hypothetical protein